jgi:hypothetical protein
MIDLEFLVQFFLNKYSDRAAAYILNKMDERLWPMFKKLLQNRSTRRVPMTNPSYLELELKVHLRFFKFISCEDGRTLGFAMLAGDEEPGVYNEAKIQVFDGREWSIYDHNIPDAQAQEFVRRAIEYEIKEMFVVRPAGPAEIFS